MYLKAVSYYSYSSSESEEEEEEEEVVKLLTDEEMNKLGAKLVKAEIMGNTVRWCFRAQIPHCR